MDKWLETKQIPSHCVSAAGVVYKDDKVLLIRSERRGWEIPGGIVEQGEAILDGLRREILEESGITDIEEIEFTLRAYDFDDLMAGDVFNEKITLNP